jgi:anthranilate phosphoribosyltransferase
MSQILAFPAQARPESQFEDDASEAAITRLLDGGDLDRSDARALFGRIVEGSLSEPLMAAAFVALRVKGETAEELTGAALALREAARPFPTPSYLFADSCGTGGDFSGSINVSTAAGLVAAGCGLPVVKHGNRSFTSKCGSADVLEALGARIDLDPLESREILDRTGFCFLLAPLYHPGIAHALPSGHRPCWAGPPGAQGSDHHESAWAVPESGAAESATARRRRTEPPSPNR